MSSTIDRYDINPFYTPMEPRSGSQLEADEQGDWVKYEDIMDILYIEDKDSTFIWRIKHLPTGLFYCSRKGRFDDEKTNLSFKGNFYTSLKHAEKVFNEDLSRCDINKAQVEKYNLERNESKWSYSKANKEDFKIVKYRLVEMGQE